jgi:hypothetical protein
LLEKAKEELEMRVMTAVKAAKEVLEMRVM